MSHRATFSGYPRAAASDTIRRKTSEKGRPADLELIDHITNEPMVFRILQHPFGLTKIFRIHALCRRPSCYPRFFAAV